MFAYLLYCWPKVLIESLTSLTNTALSCCAFNIPRALTQLSCCHNLSSPLSIITRVNPEEITNILALNLIDWFEFWIRIVFHSMQSSCISWGGGGGGGLHAHFPLIDWIESSAEKDSFFWREVILLTGASWVELSKRAGKTHFSRFSLFQKKKFWTDAWSINRHYDNWFIQVFEAR